MERNYVAVVHCIEPARRTFGTRVGEKLLTVLRIALTPSGDPTVINRDLPATKMAFPPQQVACANRSIGSFTGSVPTELERRGDFSRPPAERESDYDLGSADNPAQSGPSRRTTRYIRDAFTGNVIPSALLNPIGVNAVSYYPLPNQPVGTGSRI
jgi:hypothetical protein